MMKWKEQLNGDCPRSDSRLHDRCVPRSAEGLVMARWLPSDTCQRLQIVVKAVEYEWPELAIERCTPRR
jgi:hypothetical protein